MGFKEIFTILLAGLLASNASVIQFLGTGAVMQPKCCVKKATLTGLFIALVMFVATLITWPLNNFLLKNVAYLQLLVYVVVVVVIAEVVKLVCKGKLAFLATPDFYAFVVSALVVGVCLQFNALPFGEALLRTFSAGLGIVFVMAVFHSLKEKIDENDLPAAFRGLPISLLILGMMALAFLCF